jgi:hypothetical protein
MARPRKPSNVLAIRGAFKEHASRTRVDPKPEGAIGDPPEDLTAEQAACWRELVSHAFPGTIGGNDRDFMRYAACVWAEFKAREPGDVNTIVKLGPRLESIFGRLGMTPADRSRITVPKGAGNLDDAYAEYQAKA